MTGASGIGGKGAQRDIFSMFKGGGQIAELQKEYGKQSGLTAGNKDFNKMQRGYSAAAVSQKSQAGKSQRS